MARFRGPIPVKCVDRLRGPARLPRRREPRRARCRCRPALFVLNVAVLSNGQSVSFGCSGLANYGIRVDIKYQVLDLLLANMSPPRTRYVFRRGWLDRNIGPTGFTNSTATTATDGTFHDVPLGGCANGAFSSLPDTQFITIIMPDGSAPAIRGQTFTLTGQSAGHGTLNNSVSDISATR